MGKGISSSFFFWGGGVNSKYLYLTAEIYPCRLQNCAGPERAAAGPPDLPDRGHRDEPDPAGRQGREDRVPAPPRLHHPRLHRPGQTVRQEEGRTRGRRRRKPGEYLLLILVFLKKLHYDFLFLCGVVKMQINLLIDNY